MGGLLISIEVYQNIICRQVKLLLWLNNNNNEKKSLVPASPSQAAGLRRSIIYPVTRQPFLTLRRYLILNERTHHKKAPIYAFLLFAWVLYKTR